MPIAVSAGAAVDAGALNLSGALRVRVTKEAGQALLDEVNALLAKAMEQRSSYVRIADRAARFYAPVVHLTALRPFSAGSWSAGLAALPHRRYHRPHHHLPVRARARGAGGAGRGRGRSVSPWAISLNSGEALERLAEAGTIVFDKTGTLTDPRPTLANGADIAPADLALAGSLALSSKHPLAKAIADASGAKAPLSGHEFPGGASARSITASA